MNADSRPQTRHEVLTDSGRDLLASVVVFLVALPLCMGIALASGVPVAAGLITGIVGGIVVASISGCPLQVSGPAAGLTVIVYDIVQRFGLETLGIVVFIGGVVQVLLGLLRLGQWFRAVSPAVVQGMLGGIGVLILASQFHVMVDDKPNGSGIQNLLSIPSAVWKGLGIPELPNASEREFRIAALTKIGELHRQQVHLHEQVAEFLPHHPATEAPPEFPAQDRQELAQRQAEISAGLAEIHQLLQSHRDPSSTAEPPNGPIVQAASVAHFQSGQAAAALETGQPSRVLSAQTEAVESIEGLSARLKNHRLAAWVGILTIAIIVLWQGLAPKSLRMIPAPLVAVLAATILATAGTFPVLYVEVPLNLWEEVRLPSPTVLASAAWVEILSMGLFLAVIASAETLLSAAAVDRMHQGPRAKNDRELVSQGVGNMLCGLVGALPMTGVIVRSSANVQAGARTRWSAFFHGLWLLVFVAGFASLLRMIPTASLAAILVYTGYKLVNFKAIGELRKFGWGEVGIYAATVVTIVVTDLLTGVLVGIGLAAAKLLFAFSHLSVRLEQVPGERRMLLRLEGAATFIRLPQLASALENMPENAELHLDFTRLDYIDHACLDLLTSWAKQHEAKGGKLVVDWVSLRSNGRRAGNGAARNKGENAPRSELLVPAYPAKKAPG